MLADERGGPRRRESRAIVFGRICEGWRIGAGERVGCALGRGVCETRGEEWVGRPM